jgi:hypothetical protein
MCVYVLFALRNPTARVFLLFMGSVARNRYLGYKRIGRRRFFLFSAAGSAGNVVFARHSFPLAVDIS